ncbi:hypothetical protein AB4Z55_03135 [Gordonia sp. ABKF26]|uniref:hypothetical protein n=1 Tax=Gordonia sp. ABKF26 TaxID=3238687 RepID=UPI0034E3A96B
MTRLNPSAAAADPVPVLGIASTPLIPESDAVLDELVFEAVSKALREAGIRKQEVDLSITASLDIYDGRSISSGLTNAASGGYLGQSYRLEGDAGQAIVAAAQTIAANDADVVVAVGVYNPEVSAPDRRAFIQQISNYGFEPHFDRPVALSAETVWGLHAGHAVQAGLIDPDRLAALAADEISRGATSPRTTRAHPVSAADVASSDLVNGPLTELMLPADSTGAIAMVLGSLPRARRARTARAILTGWGQGSADTTPAGTWLTDPAAPTRRAAAEAYTRAGVTWPTDQIEVVELTAPTPALHEPILGALGLSGSGVSVNPSGGVRSSYPGVANGALRLLEVVHALDEGTAAHGVAQSSDPLTGTIADTATVLVVEGI